MTPDRVFRVLIADDDDQDLNYMAGKIESWGYEIQKAEDGVEALQKCASFQPHVLVSDLRMPRMDGFELIKRLQAQGGAPPVILLTQFHNIETAITAMHEARAFWFLEKPVPLTALQVLIERATEQNRLREENERLKIVMGREAFGEMVGSDPSMQHVFALIRKVGPSKATVLITGESGTGKELVARAIHASSARREAPFVALNCAALPESLIESELFGHEKGAFTGAIERRLGTIELAHGGTLFLDEIGELPAPMQAKLLRVLEDSKVRRLGAKNEVQVDVRILAATNRDPAKAVKEGTLREDLYYRLNVFHIEIPPLRARKSDIPSLVHAMLASLKRKHGLPAAGINPEVLARLERYQWPGNVRELRNVIERAMILAMDSPINVDHLPIGLGLSPIQTASPQTAAEPEKPAPAVAAVDSGKLTVDLGSTLYEVEKALILATLPYAGNNRRQTAEILGLSLKTVHIKLKEYRLAGEAVPTDGYASEETK